MPQSFKNAWRWLVGASAAAMLIASISPAANAQQSVPNTGLITVCVGTAGRFDGVNIKCPKRDFQLTWNIPGPTGPTGVQGALARPARLAWPDSPVCRATWARWDRRDRWARWLYRS